MKVRYVLATNGGRTAINLVEGNFPDDIAVGSTFERDPLLSGMKFWTVVKVFDQGQQVRLQALHNLLGQNDLAALFHTTM
jgi:hypothetical protein